VEHLKGDPLVLATALFANIRLGLKTLLWTNTLAYYKNYYITDKNIL